MNASELARRYGVDHSQISRAISRGEIVPELNGLIDVEQADATYGRRRALRASERAESREAVGRREQAIITRTAAQVMQMRRKAELTRTRFAERNKAQVEISNATSSVYTSLAERQPAGIALLSEAIDNIRRDLGDLIAEGLKVTRV